MRALAELLQDLGCRITGSDVSLSNVDRAQMRLRGLRVSAGHSARQLPVDADVLIYSPAVSLTNPERQAAGKLGMLQFSLPQMLGRLMQSRQGVCVAGTHGKTTTTALIGHLLESAGFAPSVVCGGEDCSRRASGWAGQGNALVVESCEYRRHFLNLAPKQAILLNIEADHVDCFPTLDDAVDAFGEFVARIPPNGVLIVNRDCPDAMRAAERAETQVITIGRGSGRRGQNRRAGSVDWSFQRLRRTTLGWSFLVERNEECVGRFQLPSPLRHNVMNALAGIALGDHLGVSRHQSQLGVRTFAGVRRRFERLELGNGVTLIDDYAHHPTAIAGVLAAVRERYLHRRLWCAFQPHQISRTQALMSQFAEELARADIVLLAPLFTARETSGRAADRTARELARLTARRGVSVRILESLDEITRTIETETRPGDLFLTLGAGDIDSIAAEVARRLRRPRAC